MLPVRVLTARWESQDVTSYELADPEGQDLPEWSPGAHLDVHLPSGAVRQYSLCGDVEDRSRYRIAILAMPDGRGGSIEAHRELRPGVEITISRPRLTFELVEAKRYVFIAGGIGITPLLPMIREVSRRGRPWELIYGARSREHFTFAKELRALGDDLGRACLVPEDAAGLLDLAAVVAGSGGAVIYACGSDGLMEALSTRMEEMGRGEDLHLERFTVAPRVPEEDLGDDFEVEVASTGQVIPVGKGETILDAVRAAGLDHPSSCEMGICGTCETKVLAGCIDHRDDLLTEEERAAGDTMMICVSRAACPRLVLDL